MLIHPGQRWPVSTAIMQGKFNGDVKMCRSLGVGFKRRCFTAMALALAICMGNAHRVSAGAAREFDALAFFKMNTTFFADFGEFRKRWFAVEDRISGIKDEYEAFDWKEARNRARDVVIQHEALMVKFARDCRAAKARLSVTEAAQAQEAIGCMLEYLDSVGLVVLKLYEITEKLYRKTLDPYSYTMEAYNADFRKFKDLNDAFEKKGKEVNVLLYGERSPLSGK